MKYRVRIQPEALAELEACYEWLAHRNAASAVKWFNGFAEALERLAEFPEGWSIASESVFVAYEVRQLLYGKRQHKYRALFTIVEDTVHVLHIRHAARQYLNPEDLPREPPDAK